MSATQTFQIANKYTDSQGQVVINQVPYGNYTISVYYMNKFVENVTASTTNALNFLVTQIPQFPVWVIIYASISLVFVMSGLKIYKKNSRI
jgi:hypothetical protein